MIGSILFVLLAVNDVSARTTAKNHSESEIVHDQVLPLPRADEQGVLTSGRPLPDWSSVKRRAPHYVEVLLAVDAAVARHYGHAPERIRAAMLMLMHSVNMYAYQLDIRITIVDVVPVHGYNVSLEQFLEWRQTAENLFFPEAPYEYASVFFHELSHLLGLSHSARANCRCSKKNHGDCLRIEGFDYECSAQALVDLLPSIECLTEPKELPRNGLPLCGNGIVEDDEDCDCGPAKYCNNVFCEPRTCRFIIARQYLYTTVTFGAALVICGALIFIKRKLTRPPEPKISKKPPFPPPNKPMLYTDSPPTELAPPYLPARKNFETTSQPPSSTNIQIQLPAAVRTPILPAPKHPVHLRMDTQIPVQVQSIFSDYVPMHPPKTMEIARSETALRQPPSSPYRPEISDPIPTIVAGKIVNAQAQSSATTANMKPSQHFLACLEDTLKVQTLDCKRKLSPEAVDLTLPRPPVPDRSKKPVVAHVH